MLIDQHKIRDKRAYLGEARRDQSWIIAQLTIDNVADDPGLDLYLCVWFIFFFFHGNPDFSLNSLNTILSVSWYFHRDFLVQYSNTPISWR